VCEVKSMFDLPKLVCPFVLVVAGKNAKHLSDCFVGAFHLSVGVLMEGGGEDELDVE